MKKQFIVFLVIPMLIFSVLISCSGTTDPPPDQSIIGAWELTTIKADGIVVDPSDDMFNLFSNEGIQTFNENGTGTNLFGSGNSEEFTWSINGGMLEITTSEVTFSMNYTLQSNSLSLFSPSTDAPGFPDLELIYTRV